MRTRARFTGLPLLIVAVGAGLLFAHDAGQRSPSRTSFPGETATVIPDGRTIVVGGEGSEDRLAFRDAETGALAPAASGLLAPRAWHSATMLPDGRVLVYGGLGAGGAAMAGGQLIDPATLGVEPVAFGALQARSHHTATLLTDGSVLIVGGLSARGAVLDEAALWNPLLGTVQILERGLRTARRDHTATLLADGRVLVWGGTDVFGNPVVDGETFDPATASFHLDALTPRRQVPSRPVILAGSLPEAGAVGVATNAIVALRFSDRVRASSASAETVTVSGPEGTRIAKVVPAEDGRLVFVTPAAPLSADTAYRVTASGLLDVDGGLVPPAALAFTTSAAPLENGERWDPRSTDLAEWQTRRGRSPLQDLPPLRAREGETALAGQVLTLDGRALANFTLEIEGTAARTDGTGRFLLRRVPTGRRVLEMDGSSASSPNRVYGFF